MTTKNSNNIFVKQCLGSEYNEGLKGATPPLIPIARSPPSVGLRWAEEKRVAKKRLEGHITLSDDKK